MTHSHLKSAPASIPFIPANQNGRLRSRLVLLDLKGTTTRTLTPGYDAANRVTSLMDTSATGGSFGYDSLDRLISYTATPTTQAYTYDANGNRTGLTTDGGSSTYTYTATPASNRLASVTGLVTRTNSYDSNGSLTNDGTISYAYDARGRMATSTITAITTTYGVCNVSFFPNE